MVLRFRKVIYIACYYGESTDGCDGGNHISRCKGGQGTCTCSALHYTSPKSRCMTTISHSVMLRSKYPNDFKILRWF